MRVSLFFSLFQPSFSIAEKGLEAALTGTEVFQCALVILENTITVDYSIPLDQQFTNLNTTKFLKYANRNRRDDIQDYTDGIRARLDVKVESIEYSENEANAIAVRS